MTKLHQLHRPSPKQLAMDFRSKTKCTPPKRNKSYWNPSRSSVSPIPEYAPMGGVLIAYPGTILPEANKIQLSPSGRRSFGIPNELIVRMQQNESRAPVHIFVMCGDLDERDHIVRDMQKTAGELGLFFNPDHLHLIPWDTDTFWTVDYGPWWIRNKVTGSYGIVKHTYTTLGGGSVGLVEGAEDVGPSVGLGLFRPNDDYGAVKVADYLNTPIRTWNRADWSGKKNEPIPVNDWFYLGLLDVGGNYMVTSKGVIASSYLVATQNELPPVYAESEATDPSQQVIDQRLTYILEQLNRFMGVHTYHVFSEPKDHYIGHIDCWGKFLSDDKVLIARSQTDEINKHFDKVADFFEAEGFQAFRVMCQNVYVSSATPAATTAPYTNSRILNDHVYVPLAGKGYEPYDEAALAVYREALPDYKVVGILGKPEFPWLGTDALHCRTRGLPRAVVNHWLEAQMKR